jgi:ABC-type bacteriocin/lantibiotic exporter with double-glycine peptidase domain
MNVLKIILFILGIFLMFFAPLQLIVLAIIFFGIPFLIWIIEEIIEKNKIKKNNEKNKKLNRDFMIIEEKEKDIDKKVKVEVKENKKRHKDLSKFYESNKKRLK